MQPPPGYPDGQQQPGPQNYNQQPQQYAPQQGQPQYGMQQQPYYPPPKSGFPGWAIALIVGGVFVFVILPIMAVAAIPLITTNTRDARRAEGEQLMGSARDRLRVEYSKTGDAYQTITEFPTHASTNVYDGQYFTIDPNVSLVSDGRFDAEVSCVPRSSSDGRGHMPFAWASGDHTVRWD